MSYHLSYWLFYALSYDLTQPAPCHQFPYTRVTLKCLYLEIYQSQRPNNGVKLIVFKVKESNEVMRFNIRRAENKMAANMAEILHSNDHNSSSMTGRDQILVSTLWFSRSRNRLTSSDLTLGDQKTRWRPIWRKYGIKVLITRDLSQLET